MVDDPTPEQLEHERGLTYEEEESYRALVNLCEGGISRFTNDQVSQALVLVERLRDRWARAHGVARAFAEEAAERDHAPGRVALADQLAKEIEAHAGTKVALEALGARSNALLNACARLPDRSAKTPKNGNRWKLWTREADAAFENLNAFLREKGL